jgi:hypothetical protein
VADHAFLSAYKTHYSISADTADALLNQLLDSIEKKIRLHTGGVTLVNTSDVTEVQDGDGKTGFFYTRQRPVQSITTVHENVDTPRAYDSDSLVDSDYYSFNAETGKIYKISSWSTGGGVWAQGYDTVQVVYKPGYATVAAVPDDLVLALYEWVRQLQTRTENRRQGIRSANAADGSVTYDNRKMPEIVEELLESYTPIHFGTAWGM